MALTQKAQAVVGRMCLRKDKYMTNSYFGEGEGKKKATGRLTRGHDATDSLQLLEKYAVPLEGS